MRTLGETEQAVAPMPVTGGELHKVLLQEKRGDPFLIHRDEAGEMVLTALESDDGEAAEEVTVGRDAANAIPLTWDREVSRLHARLTRRGGEWIVDDDGLSRNGTYVNGERMSRGVRLRDRDLLRVGQVAIAYRDPAESSRSRTLTSVDAEPPELSAAEARVLAALAAPWVEGDGVAAPAGNGEIAEQLVISVHTVKSHLRSLFAKFELDALPQSKKRSALVEAAFRTGLVERT